MIFGTISAIRAYTANASTSRETRRPPVFAIVNCFVSMSNSPIADKVTVMGYYVYSKGSSDIGFSYAASVVMLALTSAISLSVKIAMDKLGEAI